jgi:hypothetical protein
MSPMEHRSPHGMVACVTAHRLPRVVRRCRGSNQGRGRPPSHVITDGELRARYQTTVFFFSRSLAVAIRAWRCACPSAVGRCPHRAPARLAQTRLCSAWPLPLGQSLPGCWATPMLTGWPLRADHPLEPWPRATLGAGMPRGMVHRDEVGCQHGRVICGHGGHASPLGMAGVSGHLPGTRRGLGRWPSSAGGACQQRDASVWPRVGPPFLRRVADQLVPVSQYCGEELRRLAFGQPHSGGNA